MREYELTVIFDLSLTESQGAEASLEALKSHVEARGGRVLSADRWGRRRMAFPINGAIDGDYIVSRVEMESAAVQPLHEALRIDERVYRYLAVRADELPPPPAPREPRRRPEAEQAPAPAAVEPAPAPAAVEPAPPPAAVEPAPVDSVPSAPAEAPASDTEPAEVSTPPATVGGENSPSA